MRHRKIKSRLSMKPSHRKAVLKNLVRALFLNERIETTIDKAKQTRKLAEKLITIAIAEKNTLSARRKVYAVLNDRVLISRLFDSIAPLFKNRDGGYTRIIRTANRKGDNAEMAILELVEKRKNEIIKSEKVEEEPKKSNDKISEEIKEKKTEDKTKEKTPEKTKNKFISGMRKFFGKDKKNK